MCFHAMPFHTVTGHTNEHPSNRWTSTTQQTGQNSKTFLRTFILSQKAIANCSQKIKNNPAQHGRPPPWTPSSGLVEAERHRRGLTRLAGEVSRLSGRLWSRGAGVSQPRVYRVLSRGREGCGRRRENSRLGWGTRHKGRDGQGGWGGIQGRRWGWRRGQRERLTRDGWWGVEVKRGGRPVGCRDGRGGFLGERTRGRDHNHRARTRGLARRAADHDRRWGR